MIHASLFSGIGGPEVAAAMMGWENAFHCEINPFGRAVLDYWFPESKSYEDITKTDFREWRGKIDILTGGFPCQPFSYAGKRGGREDERYLWPQMLRAIDEIRPSWVVGENVAGITTMVEGGVLSDMGSETSLFGEMDGVHRYGLRQSYTIERICRDLEAIGYSVQPVLVPAASVGAPHRRDRVFILAHDERAASRQSVFAANTDCRDDLRVSGADAGTRGEERLQERDEVRFAGEPDQLRPEICIAVTNAASHGRNGNTREDGEERCAGSDTSWSETEGADGIGLRGFAGIHGEQFSSSNTENLFGNGRIVGHERELGRESEPELGNSGWTDVASYSDRKNIQRRDIRSEEGQRESENGSAGLAGQDGDAPYAAGYGWDGRMSDRRREAEVCGEVEGEGNNSTGELSAPSDGEGWTVADAVRSGLEGQDKSRNGEGGEWMRVRGDLAGYDRQGMLPENRWRNFPTVSPVHRGNDGLPFDVDDLTIPFAKWRTESLKAYGNAIVPQVMYRIFQAIQGAK